MFDYEYGTTTTKYKIKINRIIPHLPIIKNSESKALSFVYGYLSGLEVLGLSLVKKSWYTASWDQTLWRKLSKVISTPELTDALFKEADLQIEKFLSKLKGEAKEISYIGTIKWKIIYIQLLYKYCSHCKSLDQKPKFLPILQKTICFNCAKLPDFAMISLENAMNEYGITKEDIEIFQLDGLRVAHTNKSGKFMNVYYLFDILKIVSKTNPEKIEKKINYRKNIEERRRTEIVYYLKKEGVDDNFISMLLDTEGTLAHSYMLGKSKSTAHKIGTKLAKIYWYEEKKKINKEKKEKKLKEKGKPRKRWKEETLTEEETIMRKIQLIDRLTLMGLDTEYLDFEDTEGLAYNFIHGKSKKDLGTTAGTIWREFKPIFTGISSSTTQRIKDL